jgi:ankyrin repeat protein
MKRQIPSVVRHSTTRERTQPLTSSVPTLSRPLPRIILSLAILITLVVTTAKEADPFARHFHPLPRLAVVLAAMAGLACVAFAMDRLSGLRRWILGLGASGLLLITSAVVLFGTSVAAMRSLGKASGEAALGALLLAAVVGLLGSPVVTGAILALLFWKRGRPRPVLRSAAFVLEGLAVVAIALLLLSSGYSLRFSMKRGESLLAWAAREGQPGLVRFLLNRGADPRDKTQDGETPLLAAIAGCRPTRADERKAAVVDLLLAAGADPDGEAGGTGGTPLLVATSQPGGTEIVKALLAHGANPNLGRSVDTPLRRAVQLRKGEMVPLLISAGALVDEGGDRGITPLMVAVGRPVYQQSERAIVDQLLSSGARVDVRDSDGHTVLHWAALGRDRAVIERLLAAGADPSVEDVHGHLAVDLLRTDARRHFEENGIFADAPPEELVRLLTPAPGP